MKKFKVVVLDFDNCLILDPKTRTGSEELKDEAWYAVFAEYPREQLTPVLAQAQREIAGGKGDRRDVVKKVLAHFGHSEQNNNEVDFRCGRFNNIVRQGIMRIGISDDARHALSALSTRVSMHLNTATPIIPARELLRDLGIEQYFKGVYGRPGTKVDNLRAIISAEEADPNQVLFVDDTEAGAKAAHEVGCQFVGINTARNNAWHGRNTPFPIIHSLLEIVNIV